MSQEEIVVPKGWELKKLGELTSKITKGIFDISPNYYVEDGIPFLRISNIQNFSLDLGTVKFLTAEKNDEFPATQINSGDIVLAKMNGPLGGKVAIIPKSIPVCNLSQNLIGVKIDQFKLLSKFLFYFLQSNTVANNLFTQATGTSQKMIRLDVLRKLEIMLPSLPIQKQIVAKLDHILGELEVKKKQILSLIEQNKQRIDFFEKKWREYSITNILTKYPKQKEWKQVIFDDVCQKITYGFTNPMPHVEDGAWLITATNIRNGKINYAHALKTDWKSFNELITDKSRPKIGTVLIIKDGNTLGRVGIVDRENICISQSVASLEPITSKILSQFLAFVLESSEIQQKIVSEIKLNTIPHIQITSMAKWTFLLPPLSTQKQIIQTIKSAEEKFQTQKKQFENIKNNYDSKIKYINHIQSSVLDSAFSGKLLN